jgi:hypothetical protein
MFCPKCGLQNVDNAKFCRSCGVDLSHVLAVVEGKMPDYLPQSKEDNDLFSTGIRNLILGFGFIFIGALLFILPGNTFFWLLAMFPGISLLASGISRLVKAGSKGHTDYREAGRYSLPAAASNPALPPVQAEYIRPERSSYRKDDPAGEPPSITEPTTQLLEMESEDETKPLTEK